MQFRTWLSRTVFESMLIVFSILLALGVAQWQQDRQVTQLVERSLRIFKSELTQNRNRIEDLYPFHLGLQSLLLEQEVESHPDKLPELREVLDSFESAVLLTSAWDTALATGALAQMDYEVVFALSLTYSIQDRFQTLYNSGLIETLSTTVSSESAVGLSYAAIRYVNDVTSAESELLAVYQQALELFEPDSANSEELRTLSSEVDPALL